MTNDDRRAFLSPSLVHADAFDCVCDGDVKIMEVVLGVASIAARVAMSSPYVYWICSYFV